MCVYTFFIDIGENLDICRWSGDKEDPSWLGCSRFKPSIFRADIPHNSDLPLKNVTDINIFKHLKTKHCLMFLLTDQG